MPSQSSWCLTKIAGQDCRLISWPKAKKGSPQMPAPCQQDRIETTLIFPNTYLLPSPCPKLSRFLMLYYTIIMSHHHLYFPNAICINTYVSGETEVGFGEAETATGAEIPGCLASVPRKSHGEEAWGPSEEAVGWKDVINQEHFPERPTHLPTPSHQQEIMFDSFFYLGYISNYRNANYELKTCLSSQNKLTWGRQRTMYVNNIS